MNEFFITFVGISKPVFFRYGLSAKEGHAKDEFEAFAYFLLIGLDQRHSTAYFPSFQLLIFFFLSTKDINNLVTFNYIHTYSRTRYTSNIYSCAIFLSSEYFPDKIMPQDNQSRESLYSAKCTCPNVNSHKNFANWSRNTTPIRKGIIAG